MSTMTDAFFGALSSKFRKENDLSDLTWAMIVSSPFFKEKWLRFFFSEDLLQFDDVSSIDREVIDEQGLGSRADFVIKTFGGDVFVIEVKIGDTNHHFGQYEKAYRISRDHFGYIVNYPLIVEGYTIKQWKEFYVGLHSSIDSIVDEEEKNLVSGYCNYLKNVCFIMTVDHLIDIERLASLCDLAKAFQLVISQPHDDFEKRFYKDMSNDISKKYSFAVRYHDLFPNEDVYPYIGIWYDLPLGPRICAGFWKQKGWGKRICEFMDQNKKYWGSIELKYSCTPEEDKWEIYFFMSASSVAQFRNAKEISEQIEILGHFLDEVLSFPLYCKRCDENN